MGIHLNLATTYTYCGMMPKFHPIHQPTQPHHLQPLLQLISSGQESGMVVESSLSLSEVSEGAEWGGGGGG
jgi:hypothetical protein